MEKQKYLAEEQLFQGLNQLLDDYRRHVLQNSGLPDWEPPYQSSRWAREFFHWLRPFLRDLEKPLPKSNLFSSPSVDKNLLQAKMKSRFATYNQVTNA